MSLAPVRLRIVFMGTPEFSVPTLKALSKSHDILRVYTQPDKPVGRGMKMTASPVKQAALELGIPVFTPEKISTEEEASVLKDLQADVFVVVAYGQILKRIIIDLPRLGCINIHSSLLPRWRGAAPIHWALLSGDKVTGITTMKIVPKLDAGDMLLQRTTEISDIDTVTTLHDRLSQIGSELILETLQGLAQGQIQPQVQDESLVTYAHKLTKEMEEVPVGCSAKDLDLRVRTLNPWPGVRALFPNGMSLKIKKGKLSREPVPFLIDGFQVNDTGVYYRDSKGVVYEATEVQEEGKRAVSTKDFINGLAAKLGEKR